jgi:hypothetical protein
MIRITTIGLLVVVIALQGAATQKSRIIMPLRDNVGVYHHEIRKVFEEPYFIVGTADRLQVIATGKRNSKVVDREAREGWIENRLCTTAPGGKLITFDPAMIEQYSDIKSPMNISAGTGPEDMQIRLDRSFRDALSENVDRETVSRVCGQ